MRYVWRTASVRVCWLFRLPKLDVLKKRNDDIMKLFQTQVKFHFYFDRYLHQFHRPFWPPSSKPICFRILFKRSQRPPHQEHQLILIIINYILCPKDSRALCSSRTCPLQKKNPVHNIDLPYQFKDLQHRHTNSRILASHNNNFFFGNPDELW